MATENVNYCKLVVLYAKYPVLQKRSAQKVEFRHIQIHLWSAKWVNLEDRHWE